MAEPLVEGQTALLGDRVEDPARDVPETLRRDDSSSAGLRTQSDGSLDRRSDSVMAEVTLRWLLMVFFVTLFLLAFQVIAGFCSGSLALLADSAHSSIDVITYGLNYFVERLKVRSEARGRDLSDSTSLASKVDLFGGAISTVALLMATGFAASEAIARLRSQPDEDGDGEFNNIGPVLLVFAVVSTLANLGILMTFVRWQAAAKLVIDERDVELASFQAIPDFPALHNPAGPPPLLAEPEHDSSGRLKAFATRSSASSAADPLPSISPLAPLDLPNAPPVPYHVPAGALQPRQSARQLARGGRAARTVPNKGQSSAALNIRSDYSSLESGCGPACGSDCGPNETHGLRADAEGGDREGGNTRSKETGCLSSCCASGAPGDQQSWSSMLHMLVHPGCTDAAHASPGADLRSGGTASPSAPAKENNLNLSAAMLHLIADVVRGFTILISAIVIQAGVVSNAGKADAVCALLVAVFILIGAAAILQRLMNAFRDSCGAGFRRHGPS